MINKNDLINLKYSVDSHPIPSLGRNILKDRLCSSNRSEQHIFRKLILFKFEGIFSKKYESICKNVMLLAKVDTRLKRQLTRP
jgi:hypothetical protein